jgi:hypothetical protein
VAAFARTASVEQIATVARRASNAGVEVQELARFAVNAPARPGLMLGLRGLRATALS